MKAALKNRKWQITTIGLAIALAFSIGFNVYQIFDDSNSGSNGTVSNETDTPLNFSFTGWPDAPMNFTFTWGPNAQNIVDGTFRIDISVWFENDTSPWDNATYEMFYIIIRVYDDDYCSDDYLGLVFDENRNGVIDFGHEDRPQLLYADNSTIGVATLTKEGFLGPAEVPREEIYTCTYEPEKGYAFGPFGALASDLASNFGDNPPYIPVYICFRDTCLGISTVSVEFRIHSDS